MRQITLFTTICFLFLSAFSRAEDPNETSLRLNLKPGTQYEIVSHSKIDYFTDATLSEKVMGMDWDITVSMEVLEKSEEGIHKVKTEITNIKANQNAAGMSIAFDSDKETDDPMAGMLAQQFEPLIKKPMIITVNNRGEVTDVLGENDEQEAGSTAISFSDLAQGFFVEFPEQSLEKGDTWKQEQGVEMAADTKINMSYTATKISSGTVEISYEADEESIITKVEGMDDFEIALSGTYTFDKKTGMILTNKSSNSIKGTDPQMGEFFMVTTTEQNSELK